MQLTSNIMMVRPAHFGFNPETAENNAFQINDKSLNTEEIKQKAIIEFDAFVEKLIAGTKAFKVVHALTPVTQMNRQ